MSFLIVIPTLNAGALWADTIASIRSQSLFPFDVLVVDSGSIDDTVRFSCEAGFKVQHLCAGEFNHGGTRKRVLLENQSYDFIVFMTQDAIVADIYAIKNILLPFEDSMVFAVCGRQLPRINAGVIETHARLFNYPATAFVMAYADRGVSGVRTAFLSNSFAAYRVSALVDICGFPEDVIFGEDMYVAGRLLKVGGKIAYAANTCVYHSHNYTLIQEMQRYFDMGVFHARESWLRKEFGGAEKEGFKFVISELKYLARHAFWRIPEGLLRTALRYMGFRLGLLEKYLPLPIKKRLCMNKGYFNKS